MARASRSSKKQPAFDPSELSDLIFSPAVGTGVGSHLLEIANFPADPSSAETRPVDLATVAGLQQSTVELFHKDMTTVDNDNSTVVADMMSTVDGLDLTTVDITGTSSPAADAATPDRPQMPTVDMSGMATVTHMESPLVFWITDHGNLVPEGRVKQIRLARDVINSAEQSVYDTLWTTKAVQGENDEAFRVVQGGYDYLGKKTGFSKKTIQRIVAKLIDKDFIAIERPADIYQRSSTVYRVFSSRTVLEHHIQKGRSHVAKIGPGFSYVRPLSNPAVVPGRAVRHLSTVGTSHSPTVVGPDTSSGIRQALSQYGAVDDGVIHHLIKSCKLQAPDCTEEEIIHFIQEKGALVTTRDRRIYSPLGFLLTAVPGCFSGEAFRLYREAEAAYEAKRQAELDEWRREQEARLADPHVSEEDKQFIRECLGIQ